MERISLQYMRGIRIGQCRVDCVKMCEQFDVSDFIGYATFSECRINIVQFEFKNEPPPKLSAKASTCSGSTLQMVWAQSTYGSYVAYWSLL